jgi:hypothetical protein
MPAIIHTRNNSPGEPPRITHRPAGIKTLPVDLRDLLTHQTQARHETLLIEDETVDTLLPGQRRDVFGRAGTNATVASASTTTVWKNRMCLFMVPVPFRSEATDQ